MPSSWAHQDKAIAAVYKAYKSGKRRIVLVLPTGAGKTRTATRIAKANPSLVCMFVVHRDELMQQAIDAFAAAGVAVNVVTIQGLLARNEWPPAGLIFYDECHHAASDQWSEIFTHYSDALIIGLTATPERSDGLGLGDYFDELVVGATIPELIESGVLTPCEIYAPAHALRSSQIAARPVDAWNQYAKGHKTIVFAQNAQEAALIESDFLAQGTPARYVRHDHKDRADAIAAYRAGAVQVLINQALLTEGFDAPDTTCVVIARTVGSPGLWIQIIGRAIRSAPGKTVALVLDLTGQSNIHGNPATEEYAHHLTGSAIRRKGAKVGEHFCPYCGIQTPGGTCEDCAYLKATPAGQTVTNDPLVRFARMRVETPEQRKSRYFKWMDLAMSEGKHPGSVYHKYKYVYGCEPPWEWQHEWRKHQTTSYTAVRAKKNDPTLKKK